MILRFMIKRESIARVNKLEEHLYAGSGSVSSNGDRNDPARGGRIDDFQNVVW